MYGSSKMMILISKRSNVYMRRRTEIFSLTCSLNLVVFIHTPEYQNSIYSPAYISFMPCLLKHCLASDATLMLILSLAHDAILGFGRRKRDIL